ncbi:hypothetical protein ACFL6H_04440 [Candidatus Latescibacterota bacterium]
MLDVRQLPDCLSTQRWSQKDTLLLILAVDVDTPKKVAEIKSLGRKAGCIEILKWNISVILKRTKGLAIHLPEGWCLSNQGRNYVISLNIIQTKKSRKVINQERKLREEVAKINDANTKVFLEETIAAYEGGLYRSCVVLSWIGALSLLYDYVIHNCLTAFNSEAKRRDARWKNAHIKDDLARMKESDFLDIIGGPPISVIGKNTKEELKSNCLRLRNSCGHPNTFKIGEHKTSAHLEVLILNVYSKFS